MPNLLSLHSPNVCLQYVEDLSRLIIYTNSTDRIERGARRSWARSNKSPLTPQQAEHVRTCNTLGLQLHATHCGIQAARRCFMMQRTDINDS